MKRNAFKAFTAFVLALSLGQMTSACNTTACTPNIVPSTAINVVDEEGHSINDPKLKVEYQVGSEAPWRPCDAYRQGEKSTWSCGEDIRGTFNVRATLDTMSGRTDGIVVRGDECHVRTEQVNILLQ